MEELETSQEQQSAEQKANSRPWLYKKGQSGNPSGRPKGSKSLKTYVKERLESMTEEEREVFLDGLPKSEIWKMAEGNPHQSSDSLIELKPIPLLNAIRNNISHPKDSETQQKN